LRGKKDHRTGEGAGGVEDEKEDKKEVFINIEPGSSQTLFKINSRRPPSGRRSEGGGAANRLTEASGHARPGSRVGEKTTRGEGCGMRPRSIKARGLLKLERLKRGRPRA